MYRQVKKGFPCITSALSQIKWCTKPTCT